MKIGFTINAEALKKGEKLFRHDCVFVAGVQSLEAMPESRLPEIAFAGRSNVGKSSLINALTGRKALARSSSTPGRTQQINFFDLGGVLRLVDLPGYGYAQASKEKIKSWNELVRTYLRGAGNLQRVCLLIDARHGIKAADQEMMELLDGSRAPYIIVLTKADKTAPDELAALKVRIEKELGNYKVAFPVIYETSAESKDGIAELRAVLALA